MEKQNFNEKPQIGILEEQKNLLEKTINEFQEKFNKTGNSDEENELAIDSYRTQLKNIKDKLNEVSTEKAADQLIDSILEKSEEKNISQMAKILKNNEVSQILLHSPENKEQAEKWGLSLRRDADTAGAVRILSLSNIKYREDAVTSFVHKGGGTKDVEKEAERTGVRLMIDAGGSWAMAEGYNGTKTLYLDHHGDGQHKPTSATEITYKVNKKAGLLEEPEPEWLQGYIKFINELDNLTYLNKTNEKGEKIYNKDYFEKEWAKTPYALTEVMPTELLKAYEIGKIKDPSVPLTKEQMKEIGGEKLLEKFKEISIDAKKTIAGIENADRNNKKQGLKLNNTRLGKIVYHNFPKMKIGDGREFVNQIKNNIAFTGASMMGYDTYVCWNKKNENFFISSKNPNLEAVIDELNKKNPGCIVKDVRGEMVFGKISEGLTEEEFLNILDTKILKK
jgi:hypothetical protein